MPYLHRWDPFHGMARAMRFNFPAVWEEDWDELEDSALRFSVDMYEEDNAVILEADLPGVDPEDVDVTVTEEAVTISAKKEEAVEEKKRDYLRRERRFGSFTRTLALPSAVQPDKAKAEFKSGTLTLRMPKVEEGKAKQVKVKIEGGTK